MRAMVAMGAMIVALLVTGCGGSDEHAKTGKKEQPMKVEDTAFGPLVGTPKKVQDRTDAAADLYRENLNKRLEQDEGAPQKDRDED
jgi:hypothetical protein